MSEIINAKGLSCPEPVILTKKALESFSDVEVLVDNTTAVENIKRLATGAGCSVEVSEEAGGIFRLYLKKKAGSATDNQCTVDMPLATGPTVFVIASDTMGKGSDELGAILMRALIHTVTELEPVPEIMIFYNAAVKLAVEGSVVLDDLRQLEEKGVRMLICGTCLNYFELTGKVETGIVSNMYDIVETLSKAGRIVRP